MPCAWIAAAQAVLQHERLDQVASIDLAENVAGDSRACHIDTTSRTRIEAYAALAGPADSPA